MDRKNILILVTVLLGFCGMSLLNTSYAKPGSDGNTVIAVIQLWDVMKKCDKNVNFMDEIKNEQERVENKLKQLNIEIQSLEAQLETRKPGSKDSLELMQKIMETESKLNSNKEFHQKSMPLRVQMWRKELHDEVLGKINEVAQAKGIDVVLNYSSTDQDIPASSLIEQFSRIRGKSVVYNSEDVMDISEDVLEAMNKSAGSK